MFRLDCILVKPSQHEKCFSNLVLASTLNSVRCGSAISKSPDLPEAGCLVFLFLERPALQRGISGISVTVVMSLQLLADGIYWVPLLREQY